MLGDGGSVEARRWFSVRFLKPLFIGECPVCVNELQEFQCFSDLNSYPQPFEN
jgi:hypothetical protein